VKIYDCYAAGSGWWNVIGRPLPWGSKGDTESGGQGLVGACEGCRNTGLIARLIGTPASWCGSWLALSRLISPFVPPLLVALVRCEKHHPMVHWWDRLYGFWRYCTWNQGVPSLLLKSTLMQIKLSSHNFLVISVIENTLIVLFIKRWKL